MYGIKKGIVTTVEGNRARVESAVKPGDVTRFLTIPDHINMEKLKKGTKVVYVVFEDMTGTIMAII